MDDPDDITIGDTELLVRNWEFFLLLYTSSVLARRLLVHRGDFELALIIIVLGVDLCVCYRE